MSEPEALTGSAANLREFIQKYWPTQEGEGNRLYASQLVIREIGLVLCDYAIIASRADAIGAMDAVERLEQLFKVLSVSIFAAVRKSLANETRQGDEERKGQNGETNSTNSR